ncbi:MAG: GNAT family N-acetyltransferase [Evtepia gabavorous]
MEIRTAAPQDLPAVTRLEALCFPPAEAAPKAAFRDRLAACPQTCWLLWEGDTLLAMVNGMTVQTPDLTDAMYETTALHDPAGPWLMIFGVDTHPDHRRRGYAGRCSRHAIQAAGTRGGRGWCSPAERLRFIPVRVCQRGVSASVHGRTVWCQMQLAFEAGLRGWRGAALGSVLLGASPRRWNRQEQGPAGGAPFLGRKWKNPGEEFTAEHLSGGVVWGSCTSRWLPGLRPH